MSTWAGQAIAPFTALAIPHLLSSKWLAGLHGSSTMPTPLLLSGWEVMIHQRQLNNGVGSLLPPINNSFKPPDLTNSCHIQSAFFSCWTIKDAFPNVFPLPLCLATLVSIGFHQHSHIPKSNLQLTSILLLLITALLLPQPTPVRSCWT